MRGPSKIEVKNHEVVCEGRPSRFTRQGGRGQLSSCPPSTPRQSTPRQCAPKRYKQPGGNDYFSARGRSHYATEKWVWIPSRGAAVRLLPLWWDHRRPQAPWSYRRRGPMSCTCSQTAPWIIYNNHRRPSSHPWVARRLTRVYKTCGVGLLRHSTPHAYQPSTHLPRASRQGGSKAILNIP